MSVKVNELLKMLQADGWKLARQKAVTDSSAIPCKSGTVAEWGKPSVEAPPGTLNSVLKQAGLKK